MRRLVISGFIVFLAHGTWAQDVLVLDALPLLDTISTPMVVTAEEVPFEEDSVVLEAILAADLEYIPAGESAELIADRLGCLQQKIPLDYNDKVAAFINYFTIRDREYMRMILRRKDVYFPLFEKYLAQYKLPQELKYLSIIESGLNPRAVSRARAVGLWQFMAGTGRYMGLRHDWYIDERMDPERSTDAACRDFQGLATGIGRLQLWTGNRAKGDPPVRIQEILLGHLFLSAPRNTGLRSPIRCHNLRG